MTIINVIVWVITLKMKLESTVEPVLSGTVLSGQFSKSWKLLPLIYCNEWFSTNRKPMLCVQDSGIAGGGGKICTIYFGSFEEEARSTLVFERFVFETTGFVFELWVLRASVFVFECFVFETTEKYSTNLAINVGGLAHLSFLFLITCGDIYNECNYAPPRGGGNSV